MFAFIIFQTEIGIGHRVALTTTFSTDLLQIYEQVTHRRGRGSGEGWCERPFGEISFEIDCEHPQ
jgi:hypothetical protein